MIQHSFEIQIPKWDVLGEYDSSFRTWDWGELIQTDRPEMYWANYQAVINNLAERHTSKNISNQPMFQKYV